MSRFALALLPILASPLLQAAEPAIVEFIPPKLQDPWVGQRVDFVIEVGVRGRFSGSTYFDLPEVSGAILMKPEERPTLSARTIEDIEYSIQRHEFSLFSQQPGELQVPSIRIRCGSIEEINAPEQKHQLEAPGFTIKTRLPEGTRPGQVVVTTSNLTIEESWDPRPGEATAGDAFSRSVTLRAGSVPGMLLPPLPIATQEGLATYPDQPRVNDQTERGSFTGSRTDRVSYVCENPGQMTIPAIEYRWWDPTMSAWQSKTLEAISFTVAPNPAFQPGETAAEQESTNPLGWWWLAAGSAALAVIGFALYSRRPPDPANDAFRELALACRNDDPSESYRCLHQWLKIAGSPSERLPAPLQRALLEAQHALMEHDDSWRGTDLLTEARTMRKSLEKSPDPDRSEPVLPPLNPTTGAR